jgi:hypothetical protein
MMFSNKSEDANRFPIIPVLGSSGVADSCVVALPDIEDRAIPLLR